MHKEYLMREAIDKLIDRFAPAKTKEQLVQLSIRASDTVAICFDSSPARVTQIMMSKQFIDPAQASLL